MAFERLIYEKDWTEPGDFPTYEDSESQVRADLQYHPDAVRDFLNDSLLPDLEGTGAAALIGAVGGTVQQALDAHTGQLEQVNEDISTLAAGGVPSVSQCVRCTFSAESWTREGERVYTISIPQSVHGRKDARFGFNLWQQVGGVMTCNTWGAASTRVRRDEEDGSIWLTAPAPYDGAVTLFGV